MTKFWRSHDVIWLLSWRDFGLITEFECFSLLFFSFFLSLSLYLSHLPSMSVSLSIFCRSHDGISPVSWQNLVVLMAGFRSRDGIWLFFSLFSLSLARSLSLYLSLSFSLSLSMQRRTCISNGGPSGAPKQNIGIFFLLTLSLLWSSWVFFLLPFSSLTLPTFAASSVHIVGSLISKLPSAIMRSCQERCSQPTLDSRL